MKMPVYDYAYFMEHESRWNTYRHGKATEVWVGIDGNILHVVKGGKTSLAGKDAVEFVTSSAWYEEFVAWRSARAAAFHRWKHETPHRRYACDRGCVAVRLNGSAVVLIHNGIGDGDYPVYRVDGADKMPPLFSLVDASIEAGTKVEVLYYDCPPYHLQGFRDEPLLSFVAKETMMIWAKDGAVVFVGKAKEDK